MTTVALVQQAKASADERVRRNLKLLKNIKGRTDKEIALGMGEKPHWVQERLSGATKISFSDARAFATYFALPVEVLDSDPEQFLKVLSDQDFHPSGWRDAWAVGYG